MDDRIRTGRWEMTATTDRGLLHDLVTGAVAAAYDPTPPGVAERTLLADLLAGVIGADPHDAPRNWVRDGTAGTAAALAARAHSRDQDDLHRPTLVHPGSVVWPTVLAVGAEVDAGGSRVAAAARAGYQAMTELARLLGATHGRTWHATATCGVLGAAVAAATLFDLDDQRRDWAAGHAVAVAGGVGQAVRERSGTTRFHRVSAVVLGIQAARLADAGVSSSRWVLEGERGVLALMAGRRPVDAPCPTGAGALAETSVRVFPVNGFAQAAVALAVDLRRRVHTAPISLQVQVSEAVAAATTGEVGGRWWDLRAAVAAAWVTGDPFRLDPTAESSRLRERVRVVPTATSATRITVRTADGEVSGQLDVPPGAWPADPDLAPLLRRKWELLVGPARGGAERVRALAESFLSGGPRDAGLRDLLGH
ncbi:MmgE/PrpD family protein [Micromonospora echinofusca]|uniref:MmgE/PrpD N-terminal domain-containing protein n=1 Tax=Micromonospora echinofusca TaxID=47858 RepID=A0ABS3VWA1_MICEH|nr:MmgE/PrpD family protein [Micromonospora echinofusca]MBO4208653.1 hypothetical protein [Micromonospora echinofusca]